MIANCKQGKNSFPPCLLECLPWSMVNSYTLPCLTSVSDQMYVKSTVYTCHSTSSYAHFSYSALWHVIQVQRQSRTVVDPVKPQQVGRACKCELRTSLLRTLRFAYTHTHAFHSDSCTPLMFYSHMLSVPNFLPYLVSHLSGGRRWTLAGCHIPSVGWTLSGLHET